MTWSRRSPSRRRSCSATGVLCSNRVSRPSCGSSSRRPGSRSRIGISCAWSSRGRRAVGRSLMRGARNRGAPADHRPDPPDHDRGSPLDHLRAPAGLTARSCGPWVNPIPGRGVGRAVARRVRGARRRPSGPGPVRARPVVTSPVRPGRSEAGLPTGGSSWRGRPGAKACNRHCGERRRACADRPTPRRRYRARCEAVGTGTACLAMAGESPDGRAVASGLLKVTAMQVSEGADMAVMNREFFPLRGKSHAGGKVAPRLRAWPQTAAAVSCS